MLHEFRLAVCDDEEIYIDHICRYLETYENESGNKIVVSRYVSGFHLLEDLRGGSRKYDILFLDVDMPVVQGIDVAMEVRKFDKDTPICFVTSYENYAFQAFQADATGYLVKPVKYAEFKRMIDKCTTQIQYTRERKEVKESYFCMRRGSGETMIPVSSIQYIEKKRNQCVFHLDSGEVTCYDTLASVYGKLDHNHFYYAHQGYIVNFDRMIEVQREKILLAEGAEIPMSRRYYKDLRKLHMEKVRKTLAERRGEIAEVEEKKKRNQSSP